MQGSSCSLFNLYSLTVFDGSDHFLQILALYSTRKSVFWSTDCTVYMYAERKQG